jgi:hypothetical protein
MRQPACDCLRPFEVTPRRAQVFFAGVPPTRAAVATCPVAPRADSGKDAPDDSVWGRHLRVCQTHRSLRHCDGSRQSLFGLHQKVANVGTQRCGQGVVGHHSGSDIMPVTSCNGDSSEGLAICSRPRVRCTVWAHANVVGYCAGREHRTLKPGHADRRLFDGNCDALHATEPRSQGHVSGQEVRGDHSFRGRFGETNAVGVGKAEQHWPRGGRVNPFRPCHRISQPTRVNARTQSVSAMDGSAFDEVAEGKDGPPA